MGLPQLVGCSRAQGFRNCLPFRDVIDDENQLMIVVAVEDLDVDAGLSHQS